VDNSKISVDNWPISVDKPVDKSGPKKVIHRLLIKIDVYFVVIKRVIHI